MSLQPFDEVAPIQYNALLIHGSSLTPVDLFPAENVARRVDQLLGTSSDTIDHKIRIFLGTGGFVPQLADVNVPAGSGVTTASPVDLLASFPSSLQGGFVLPPGAHVQVACDVDVQATFGVVIFGMGGYV